MRSIGSLAIALCALSSSALIGCESGSGNTPSKEAPARTGDKRPAAASKPTAKPKAKGPFEQSTHEAMKDPSKAVEQAPETFDVEFDTTAGKFSLRCTRDWAPHGVDRFYNLVRIGYFDDAAFFRAVKNFVVQWGIHGDPAVTALWRKANIEPDEVTQSNKKGTLTFAQAGRPAAKGMTASSRATQVFINLRDNARLDSMGFAPICEVSEGMDVVSKLHAGYGETAGRDQANITRKGNPYLREKYPLLDYIKSARLLEEGAAGDGGGDAEGGGGGEAGEEAGDNTEASSKIEGKASPEDDAKKGQSGQGQPADPPKKAEAAAPPAPPAPKAAPAPAAEVK